VEDDGVGMTRDEMERMWTRGFSGRGETRGEGLTEGKRAFLESRARLSVTSRPGLGTKVSLRVPFRPIPIRRPGLATLRPVQFGAALLVLLALASTLALRRMPEPVAYETEPPLLLKALNRDGEVLWVWRSPTPIRPNAPRLRGDEGPVIVQEGGRAHGVVLATEGAGTGSDVLRLLTPRGRQRWSEVLTARRAVNLEGGVNECRWITHVPWSGRPGSAVVACTFDQLWYHTVLRFFSLRGDSLGAYYHPGHLGLKGVGDFDGDGHTELLVYGANNSARFLPEVGLPSTDENVGCVFLLEPPEVNGQAFPYARTPGRRRDWPGIPPAREEAYVLFPLMDGAGESLPDQVVLGRNDRGERTICVSLVDGRSYWFDGSLRPRRCAINYPTPASRLVVEQRKIPRPLLVIRNGRRARVAVPVVANSGDVIWRPGQSSGDPGLKEGGISTGEKP
jgi:hypothetical protein